MKKRNNFLFLCSDQHSVFETGCYGNPVIRTPNIDSLAESGTRFSAAYSNNPICVPARASMATGMYSFQMGCCDNATPYDGQYPSFGHRLIQENIPVTTIGKLHYKNNGTQTGFCDQRIPLHVKEGKGDVYGLLREDGVTKAKVGKYPTEAKIGTSSYLEYDARVTEETLRYLDERKESEDAWVCYVGYTLPHFPLVATQETYDLYQEEDIPLPFAMHPGEWSMHPSCQDNRKYYQYEQGYSEEVVRHARHVYYAMCSYMDQQIGAVLKKLKEIGQYENTIILYTSDHGDNAGNHGLWNKNMLLEAAARVPMILSGPGVPQGKVSETPVSLVDIYPTIIDGEDLELTLREQELPGRSLLQIAKEADFTERTVFSEFHSTGSITGGFMLRKGNYKYIYYVGYKPQLFDLKADPHELCDLIENENYRSIAQSMEQELRSITDPEQINAQVKKRQEDIIDANGGREYVKKSFIPVIYSPAPAV